MCVVFSGCVGTFNGNLRLKTNQNKCLLFWVWGEAQWAEEGSLTVGGKGGGKNLCSCDNGCVYVFEYMYVCAGIESPGSTLLSGYCFFC